MQRPHTTLITEGGEAYSFNQYTVRMPNGPRVKESINNPYPSNTSDAAGNDTDVNVIMARFERTGILPDATTPPVYDDVTSLQGDLTEIHIRTMEAMEIAEKFKKAWKPPEPVEPVPVTQPPTAA